MKKRIFISVFICLSFLLTGVSAQTPPTGGDPPKETSVPVTVGQEGDRDTNPTPDKVQAAEVTSNELKLRQLAQQVEDLKNKVTATHFRLQLLKDAMTGDKQTLGGAKVVIKHMNKMGGAFKMVSLRYTMDGKLFASYSDAGEKDRQVLAKKEITIPVGHVSPGNLRFRVFVTYQGNGYGVFKYVKEWKWEVNNTHSFNAEPGKEYVLEVHATEKGGWTTPLDKRPALQFKVQSKALVTKDEAKPKAK